MAIDDALEGAMVTVRMASLPTLRYERNLLRTNLDLVGKKVNGTWVQVATTVNVR